MLVKPRRLSVPDSPISIPIFLLLFFLFLANPGPRVHGFERLVGFGLAARSRSQRLE